MAFVRLFALRLTARCQRPLFASAARCQKATTQHKSTACSLYTGCIYEIADLRCIWLVSQMYGAQHLIYCLPITALPVWRCKLGRAYADAFLQASVDAFVDAVADAFPTCLLSSASLRFPLSSLPFYFHSTFSIRH